LLRIYPDEGRYLLGSLKTLKSNISQYGGTGLFSDPGDRSVNKSV
jgi:hypothetical protein